MSQTPEEPPILTPDPYGDRVCYHRWEHRESPTGFEFGGERWCSLCYTKDEEGVRPLEPPTS